MKQKQKTIGLDQPLWDSLGRWLETPSAKDRGFHSKAQFANFAIGDHLSQFRDNAFTTMELLRQLQESHVKLMTRFDRQLEFIDKLENFWFKHNFPNIESS